MDIPEIKKLAEREGAIKIIVSFFDEDLITVGVTVTKDGFGGPAYGDYVKLPPAEHTEQAIRDSAEKLIIGITDRLKEV